jgi:CheY-like chemotaxis protein
MKADPTRGATVLVADDNDVARTVITRMLGAAGYTVWSCSGAEAALEACQREEPAFDLMLTDFVLPGMSGDELAKRAVAARTGLRVVLTSGYLGKMLHRPDLAPDEDLFEPGTAFLIKPFTQSDLLDVVARTLATPLPDPAPR